MTNVGSIAEAGDRSADVEDAAYLSGNRRCT